MVERSRTDLWLSWAFLLGCLAPPVLALAGVLDWEGAGALFIVIGCGGSLILEIVTRARNQAAGEDPALSARFFGLLALGALTGVLLIVWAD